VESALKALGKAKVTINHANEIVNRIVLDFPKYPKLHLIKLVDFCLASIRNNDDEFRRYIITYIFSMIETKDIHGMFQLERLITCFAGSVGGRKVYYLYEW